MDLFVRVVVGVCGAAVLIMVGIIIGLVWAKAAISRG
jgi:hypothetical protein